MIPTPIRNRSYIADSLLLSIRRTLPEERVSCASQISDDVAISKPAVRWVVSPGQMSADDKME
jgi:hypothetical protein